jgi:hypothetical protein
VAVEVGAREDVVDRKYRMAGWPQICLLARLVDQQAADRVARATSHKTQAQAQERLPTWGEKKQLPLKSNIVEPTTISPIFVFHINFRF